MCDGKRPGETPVLCRDKHEFDQKFASYNLQRLRGLSKADLVKEFAGLKVTPRLMFVPTGMQDLLCKLLTVLKPICLMQRFADLTLLHRLNGTSCCCWQNRL